MKNNYSDLIKKLNEWRELGEEMQKLSSLNIGVISGGPNYTDEYKELEQLRAECLSLVSRMIKNRAQLSHLKTVLEDKSFNKYGGLELVNDEIQEREYHREWARQQ